MSNGGTVFTSPNGLFTLSVTDNGISLTGPDSSVTLDTAGTVTVQGATTITLQVPTINVESSLTNFSGTAKFPNGAGPVAGVGNLEIGNPNVIV